MELYAAAMVQPVIPDYDARLARVYSAYSTDDLLEEAETLC